MIYTLFEKSIILIKSNTRIINIIKRVISTYEMALLYIINLIFTYRLDNRKYLSIHYYSITSNLILIMIL